MTPRVSFGLGDGVDVGEWGTNVVLLGQEFAGFLLSNTGGSPLYVALNVRLVPVAGDNNSGHVPANVGADAASMALEGTNSLTPHDVNWVRANGIKVPSGATVQFTGRSRSFGQSVQLRSLAVVAGVGASSHITGGTNDIT